MYAILLNKKKQYKVQEGQEIILDRIKKQEGEKIKFKTLLLFSSENKILLDIKKLNNIIIYGKILKHGKLKKISIIKYNRRKHYKKKQGHRQLYSKILIEKILIK